MKGSGSPWLNSSLLKAPEIFGGEPKEEDSEVELSTHGTGVGIWKFQYKRKRMVLEGWENLGISRWQTLGLNHHDIQGHWQFDLILFGSHFSLLLENFFHRAAVQGTQLRSSQSGWQKLTYRQQGVTNALLGKRTVSVGAQVNSGQLSLGGDQVIRLHSQGKAWAKSWTMNGYMGKWGRWGGRSWQSSLCIGLEGWHKMGFQTCAVPVTPHGKNITK